MDLFNKKKIKKLENQIYEMTCEIDGYVKMKEIGVNN